MSTKITSSGIQFSVPTINDFPTTNLENGLVTIVTDSNRGGVFVYDSTQALINNGGTVFNGWLRQYGGAVNVKWFGAKGDGVTDDTLAIQNAIDYVLSTSNGYQTPAITLNIPSATYAISGLNGIKIPFNNNVAKLCIESNEGARFIGAGTNYCFKFNADSEPLIGGGYRNIFKKLEFENFGTAIYWHTNNRDQCILKVEDCASYSNSTFIDTVSYDESRSSMITLKNVLVSDTTLGLKTYTDHTTIEDCWFYAKDGSYDPLLYLGGDGSVLVSNSFFIPNAIQINTPSNSRFIDIFASGTASDRSVKTVRFVNCRASLESARPFAWYYDYNTNISGNNQAVSVTFEDSYFGGTGGDAVLTYKQGYPAVVRLSNCKVLASPYIVTIAPTNTYPPLSSSIGSITYHVIEIDEATRLSQSNSNNSNAIIHPELEKFYYDTTSQTSKYKTSIQKNIDYRLRAVATNTANLVKCTIPIFFDSSPAVSNRGILSFMLVTVGDAMGTAYGNPAYSSTCVSLITIVGGNNGSSEKRITTTVLQDATGGISYGTSSIPSVFFGDGDTGSVTISPSSSDGTEDNITFTWTSSSEHVAWAYIIPIAGIRANQQDKMQFNVW